MTYLKPHEYNIPKAPKRKKAAPPAGEWGQRRPRVRDDAHLKAVSCLPSVISGEHGVQVCHIRYGDRRFDKRPTGMAEKPSDMWVLPMTPAEHALQHEANEQAYFYVHGIDATALAYRIYQVWFETSDPMQAYELMLPIIMPVIRRYEK